MWVFCFAIRSERRDGVRSSVLCEWRRAALRAGVSEPRPVDCVAANWSRLARVSSQLASSEAGEWGRSSERPPPVSSPGTKVASIEARSSNGGGGGGGASVGCAQPRTGDLLGRAVQATRAAALARGAGEGDLEARRWRPSAEVTISRETCRQKWGLA